ncbi:MAG: phosphoribosyltransferase [Conexivisphaera sp.]
MARRYLKLSYEEVHELSLALFHRIRSSRWMPDVNVCVGRGGLFVLRSLQDFFAAEDIRIPYQLVALERYNGVDSANRAVIKNPDDVRVAGRSVLVVDDVADYGDSLLAVRDFMESSGAAAVRTATLHLKPWSKITPDYYVARTDAWIIYPWEIYETISMLFKELAAASATVEEAYEELVSRAHVTPQELRNFNEIIRHGHSLDPRALSLLEELTSVYEHAGRD